MPEIPLLICGHQKSGTSLLSALLDGHSKACVFPEETFYAAYTQAFNPKKSLEEAAEWLVSKSSSRRLGYSQYDGLEGNLDYSDFDYDQFKKEFWKLTGNTPTSHGKILSCLMNAFAETSKQAGKKYWVEKTPQMERFLSWYIKNFPQLRAIYIVRDPRDCYLSYSKKRHKEGHAYYIENFIYDWGNSISSWIYFTARYPENHLMIRYEDLVVNRDEVIKTICRFLGIDFEDTLLSPTKLSKPWYGNSMHGDKFEKISTKPIGRWQGNLDKQSTELIESFLGKFMACYGYTCETKLANTTKLLNLSIDWIKHSPGHPTSSELLRKVLYKWRQIKRWIHIFRMMNRLYGHRIYNTLPLMNADGVINRILK